MIEDLKDNLEEHQKFHELLKQCAGEEEDQTKREESNKTRNKEKYPTKIPEDPKEESEQQNGTVNERSEEWNIEKVRLFRNWNIQEKLKVIQSLNNNPEEFQKFLGLLEHKGKEKKKKNRNKRK